MVTFATLKFGRHGVLDVKGLLLLQAGLESFLDFVGSIGVILEEEKVGGLPGRKAAGRRTKQPHQVFLAG